MKYRRLLTALWLIEAIIVMNGRANEQLAMNPLTPEEERVIIHKGTERPFSGRYEKFNETGVYLCKKCNAPLYRSDAKFDAGCGWPSFDEEIPGAVRRLPDAGSSRTEIVCARCGAHLGHVFTGEGFTPKNSRHCVNSISLDFHPAVLAGAGDAASPSAAASATTTTVTSPTTDTAVFASGCFWGTEHVFRKATGVVSTRAGYTGGNKKNPTYKEVCTGLTRHVEAVEVVYDTRETSYEALARLFFETHDPTQAGGQGPDIGDQYRSVIFFRNEAQRKTAELLIAELKRTGYAVVTQVVPASTFWLAGDYHQRYYERTGGQPYCHIYRKRF